MNYQIEPSTKIQLAVWQPPCGVKADDSVNVADLPRGGVWCHIWATEEKFIYTSKRSIGEKLNFEG